MKGPVMQPAEMTLHWLTPGISVDLKHNINQTFSLCLIMSLWWGARKLLYCRVLLLSVILYCRYGSHGNIQLDTESTTRNLGPNPKGINHIALVRYWYCDLHRMAKEMTMPPRRKTAPDMDADRRICGTGKHTLGTAHAPPWRGILWPTCQE